MVIIVAIIKIIIETIYIFTGDEKQISFFASPRKQETSDEPGSKMSYWPPSKLLRF